MASIAENNITTECYLCGKPLNSDSTPDHIIPRALFNPFDSDLPQLPVHSKCNNLKSKEDEWFIRQLQFRASPNPNAEKEISNLLSKAIKEKSDAYVIGKKPRSYIFARGMFDPLIWGLELPHNGKVLKQVQLPKSNVERFKKYIETMCRGLFILKVPMANPGIPELVQKQYALLEMKGKDIIFVNGIRKLIESSKGSLFGQQWGDNVLYVGSRVNSTPNKGYIFVQFYSQYGILAYFW